MNLIPYDGRQPEASQPLQPGTVQAVFLTLRIEDEQRLGLMNKIESWFSDRPEVSLVADGTTDKQGFYCVMLEWHSYEVDPLFIAILEEEDAIDDYTVITREEI
jgi:hypothetical protein